MYEKRGQIADDVDNGTLLEYTARVCHEANKAWHDQYFPDKKPSWEDAPERARQGAVKGVLFRINNPDATDEGQHEEWLRHHRDGGWVYGPVIDEDAKTHPCMVPYQELGFAHRKKDAIFTSIVRAIWG